MMFEPPAQPLVSVVLLSYNRPAYLREALESLLSQSFRNLALTVVDNPSPASLEIQTLVERYPTVTLIQNSTNLGYAAGMNRGIRQAAGDCVFLTEDDIVLETDCIQRLVEYLAEHPTADLLAPIIYNKAAGTIRCAGGDFALGGVYRKEIFGAGELDTGQFSQPFDVRHVDGAAMFARREFWQRFKGFREEFFMYVDAVELCARINRSGRRMTIVPQARVYHFEPTEHETPPEIEFHKLKNFFSLYLLHARLRYLPEFVVRYAVINGLRSLFGNDSSSPRVFFKALLWVVRQTPSILRERYHSVSS